MITGHLGGDHSRMHELSVCRALLRQVDEVARDRQASHVRAITLRIGPLSGVEPALLEAAYEIARRDTIAADARLVIERSVVRVRCRTCGAVCGAEPANLLCAGCGSADTELRGGDECLLLELDLTVAGSQA